MRMNRAYLIGFVVRTAVAPCISLLLSSCAGPSEWATRVAWKDVDAARLPGATEYPDAGAVIVLDEGRMEVFGGRELGFSAFDQHRIVKVLNARGQRFANVAIPYSTGSQVEDIQARTISSTGKITVLDEKNVFDVSLYPNFVFFSDQRAKIFTLPAVNDGSVIEYRYTLVVRSRALWHSWSFQSEAPTLLSRFTVIKPAEWVFDYRTYNIDIEPQVTKAPEGFKSTYVWEAKNIPALRSEFGMPPRSERSARLALSPVGFKKWADVSQWYHGLASPKMNAGSDVRALALQLTSGAATNDEKLRRIYEWVRDKVRYVAVEIGIGGYQPHAAEEILVNQYGDCKDMVTLLCSMGREAGLNMHQVLVSTWDNGMPDTSLPSPLQFNHAIAYCPSVGDSGTWMDATDKGCVYGRLPWYDQGLSVLVVGEKGEEKLMRTPRVQPDSNREVISWRAQLQSSGSATVRGVSTFWGSTASELRDNLTYASPDERRQWLETVLAKRCSGALLDSFQIVGVDPVLDSLAVSYTFHTATMALRRGADLVVRPGLIAASELPDYFRSSFRKFPIRFRFGMKREVYLSITLPEGWRPDSLAISDSTQSPFGTALVRRSDEGNGFHFHSCFLLRGEDIPAEKIKEFQEFLDRVRERDLQEVVLAARPR